MRRLQVSGKAVLISVLLLVLAASVAVSGWVHLPAEKPANAEQKDFITYVEFNVPYLALEKAMEADIALHDTETPGSWIEMLALLAARYYGDFSRYRAADLEDIIEAVSAGAPVEELAAGNSYYAYYREAYAAVLGGLLGEYRAEVPKEGGETQWETRYGLKAFSPIAKDFYSEHYDDFGAQRTYGYARRHLGHDLIAPTGTPVIAIESGAVECLGWNQYGGWRIGIRSADRKRYYYYAHLRQNRPYAEGLKEGDSVQAGDVIGYVGHTGYSTKEKVNNLEVSHLHLGMELIFDESQKECDNEIWVDLYALTTLLAQNRSAVYRVAETKEFYRQYQTEDLAAESSGPDAQPAQ